jgi:putative ABC transport system substrate-binding protein
VKVWVALQRLALGVALIALASAVLLVSDRDRRTTRVADARVLRVAIVQHTSTSALDAGVQGMIEGLAARGFRDGETVSLRLYNAQGDLATGNAIARQVTTGEFDLVLTSSTPSMQAVANANREGRTTHVFGLVADPFSAGVGLDRAHPLKHPPHMVGQGSFLPVDEAFAFARRSLPSLKIVGTAWNPAESNSEAFTLEAREACRQLGITLLEANVDGTAAVVEAVQSLTSRGVQALFIGGDNTMMSTVGSAVATARAAGIPVFTIMPGVPDRGTLLDVGLDFHELGRMAGHLAGEVLAGADPAAIPVRDVLDQVPRRVIVNTRVAAGLRERWTVPADVLDMATVVVDDTGVHDRTATGAARVPASGATQSPRH